MTDFIQQYKIAQRKDKEDITNNISKLDSLSSSNFKSIQTLEVSMSNVSQALFKIFENESVSQSLAMQDEKDRHSIALWGVKNSNQQEVSKKRMSTDTSQLLKEVSCIPHMC